MRRWLLGSIHYVNSYEETKNLQRHYLRSGTLILLLAMKLSCIPHFALIDSGHRSEAKALYDVYDYHDMDVMRSGQSTVRDVHKSP